MAPAPCVNVLSMSKPQPLGDLGCSDQLVNVDTTSHEPILALPATRLLNTNVYYECG